MKQSLAMELPDLRFVESADVYKGDLHAGTLTRLPNGDVEFSYLPDYSGEPVSFSLPLGGKAVRPGGALPAFFAGLLPEGHRLTVLKQSTKTSMDDELTMLLAVGADTPGDVRVFPAGPIEMELLAFLIATCNRPAEYVSFLWKLPMSNMSLFS
ncbi:HipA N-terminal domain-containing protein [Arcanobacterium phocae]|uniref:HipA N-terminal domain-containing protein n=1 Tax=Arcanobacterium phocae TaxID=131112 RepID=UPI00344CC09F